MFHKDVPLRCLSDRPTFDLMFAEFLKLLTAVEPAPLSDDDARLALTALLVRIARTDGEYSEKEANKISQIIVQRYGLETLDATSLRTAAETLESEAPDTVRFTRAIKIAVPHEDRIAVIEAMWQVVLADGFRDAEEDALVRLASNLLGISDRDSALARQRVTSAGE